MTSQLFANVCLVVISLWASPSSGPPEKPYHPHPTHFQRCCDPTSFLMLALGHAAGVGYKFGRDIIVFSEHRAAAFFFLLWSYIDSSVCSLLLLVFDVQGKRSSSSCGSEAKVQHSVHYTWQMPTPPSHCCWQVARCLQPNLIHLNESRPRISDHGFSLHKPPKT